MIPACRKPWPSTCMRALLPWSCGWDGIGDTISSRNDMVATDRLLEIWAKRPRCGGGKRCLNTAEAGAGQAYAETAGILSRHAPRPRRGKIDL